MVLRILLATPIGSNAVRVYFDREPRHVSAMSADDARLRANWTIEPPAGGAIAAPELETVENVRFAAPELAAHGITAATAWSIDLRVARRLIAHETYRVIGSTAIRSADGADTLSPAPDDRALFPGAILARPRRPARPPLTRSEVRFDLAYDTFEGVIPPTPAGDLAAHAGVPALRKRIYRRFMSTPGGFRHLPSSYGLGLKVKGLFDQTRRAQLRTAALEQVLAEREVVEADVSIRTFQSGVIIQVVGRTRFGDPVTLEMGAPTPGLFEVV